jgi:putative membrane protein
MRKNKFIDIIKGIVVGGSMLVPGVSGATMAMILGIYDDLVKAVSSFFSHKKQSAWLLGTFSLGGAAGVLLFAKPLLYVTENWNMPMMYFFMGAVAGSVPMIFGKAGVTKFSLKDLICTLVGIAIVWMIAVLPTGLFVTDPDRGMVYVLLLVAAGFIAAVALVLPGISVSYMLLVLGMYETTIKAIGDFSLSYLLPLGAGVLLGVALTTRILENAMNRHGRVTYLIILGFVIGSILQVFPGVPKGLELAICPVMFLISFIIIRKLSALEN